MPPTLPDWWTINQPPPCPSCGEEITDDERDLAPGLIIECVECGAKALITMVVTREYHADACSEE